MTNLVQRFIDVIDRVSRNSVQGDDSIVDKIVVLPCKLSHLLSYTLQSLRHFPPRFVPPPNLRFYFQKRCVSFKFPLAKDTARNSQRTLSTDARNPRTAANSKTNAPFAASDNSRGMPMREYSLTEDSANILDLHVSHSIWLESVGSH